MPIKILHAIEKAGIAKPALDLLTRLEFSGAQLTVAHVLQRFEPPRWLDSVELPVDVVGRMERAEEEAARRELDAVRAAYESRGVSAQERQLSGFTARALLACADESEADLIAMTGISHGLIQCLFAGSTTRAITAHAKQSVLVAKPSTKESGKLRVLVASDHSEYCNRALLNLVRFAPRGVEEIVVLSTYGEDIGRALAVAARGTEGAPLRERVHARLSELNQKLIEALKPLGVPCRSLVLDEPIVKALPRVMKETHSELLVLGAQGKGFFSRITLGSVAFRQVAHEPYSTLVMRP